MEHLEMHIQAQVIRLQRLLPPATYTSCQQVAWRIQWRLPALLAAPDWEANLLREIGRELHSPSPHGPMIMSIPLVSAAVIILIGQIMAKAKEDRADAMKEKLDRLVSRILVKLEQQKYEVVRGGLRL